MSFHSLTKCGSEKLREIIADLGDPDLLERYDKTVDSCKLGNALKDERTWAPLCPEYPNLKGVTCEEIDNFLEKTKIKHVVPGATDDNRVLHRSPEDKEFVEDYLHHVKVYDRDEAYQAFKKIGDQIEKDMPGVLHDTSTIFVTTPRGGHEMLSIFAYANDLRKSQIPSDITWEHNTRTLGNRPITEKAYREKTAKEIAPSDYDTIMFGKTWLGDRSEEVKNIFIVDDIIASGQQIDRTVKELKDMFPDANINSVTLCKRSDDVLLDENLPEKCYTDIVTSGIGKFKYYREHGYPLDEEYITCEFPHACPDGSSDKLMIELMGGERCPPEKRLSRRDL